MSKAVTYEITKESFIEQDEIVLTVKIRAKKLDGYDGYDLFPDDKLPDLIVAVGRMFSRDKKWSEINRKIRR